ncbi:hypothetical protein [Methylocapsa aurea]|uniref:hypothetical protein n=1 Tax=Methylocapsa aurea TaxID=663610 RepID=UPI0012EC29E5|nr:hypothetical protein [Methylocapsa aurea]
MFRVDRRGSGTESGGYCLLFHMKVYGACLTSLPNMIPANLPITSQQKVHKRTQNDITPQVSDMKTSLAARSKKAAASCRDQHQDTHLE